MKPAVSFLSAVEDWVGREPLISSAVLFGSTARAETGDAWSDVDLHVGARDPAALERARWERVLPSLAFRFQVVRPATGGVHKVTVFFQSGQIDLVVVPLARLGALRTALGGGRHLRPGRWRGDLNEMKVCLQSGYRFLKGEAKWGDLYARVAAEMPGVRLTDVQVAALADAALADLLWIMQKLERGELRAAQHWLHRQIAETLFRILRELRLRRGDPLPSFGLARRVERLLPVRELAWVTIDARLRQDELRGAAWSAYGGLRQLMRQLVPLWTVPAGAELLLRPYRPARPVEPVRRGRGPGASERLPSSATGTARRSRPRAGYPRS